MYQPMPLRVVAFWARLCPPHVTAYVIQPVAHIIALVWLGRAADQGIPRAVIYRDSLRQHLSPTQVAQAQKIRKGKMK